VGDRSAGPQGRGDHRRLRDLLAAGPGLLRVPRVDVEAVRALRGARDGQRDQLPILLRDRAVLAPDDGVELDEALELRRRELLELPEGLEVVRIVVVAHTDPLSDKWSGASARLPDPSASRGVAAVDSSRRGLHSDVMTKPSTVAELRQSGYRPRSVKQELRDNLIGRLRRGERLFSGIVGYEETVVPQIENAVLSGQDIVFLGERGQAKTRMARLLVGLLDEEIPALAGCEINDDPLAPICQACILSLAEQGDAAKLTWLPRTRRYGEKLATPDITIADLIGEVDPIKVAEGRYLADELTIHYGLLPRTNRGIFTINELPDLAERIQVGLLNIMEERDVQIRGY